jgi:hypothetical protein
MLEEVLGDIGLLEPGRKMPYESLLDPFSDWIRAQDVSPTDVAFLGALVAAFICEYLIECHGWTRSIEGRHIVMRHEITPGVSRELHPYHAAAGIASDPKGTSLAKLLRVLTR